MSAAAVTANPTSSRSLEAERGFPRVVAVVWGLYAGPWASVAPVATHQKGLGRDADLAAQPGRGRRRLRPSEEEAPPCMTHAGHKSGAPMWCKAWLDRPAQANRQRHPSSAGANNHAAGKECLLAEGRPVAGIDL